MPSSCGERAFTTPSALARGRPQSALVVLEAGAMILKIVQAGEPVLRNRARLLTAKEIRSKLIQELIDGMRETMRDAPGVGLAAPQIGEPLRLAVIEDQVTRDDAEREPVPFHVIVNPE